MPERLQHVPHHPAPRPSRRGGPAGRSGVALATVASLLLALLTGFVPASAASRQADPHQQRDEIRRQQAQVAAQLTELSATDDELEQGVATLEANLRAQQAKLADARRGVEDAQRHVDELNASIVEQEREVAALEAVVRRQAVERYINPDTSLASADLLLQAKDSGQGAMRQALANTVTANDQDVLDRFRTLRAQLDAEKHEVAQAADEARAAVAEAEARAHEVEQALTDHDRVRQELEARIAHVRSEAAGLAADDAALTETIRQADAEQAARREAERLAAERAAFIATSTTAAPTTRPPAPVPTTTTATAPQPTTTARPGTSTTVRPGTSTTTAPSNPGGNHVAWPVNGTVTSEFGSRWGAMHTGIDIFAPQGTPISAAKAGTVIVAGSNGGYGNLVVIDHGNGFSTAYAHMSAIGTSVGARVSQGQFIGNVGSTGHSTGPHLHFECRVNGVAQNPRNFL